MLAYLKGTIQLLQPLKRYVVVVTHDLGYKVYLPTSAIQQLALGQTVAFYLHQVIREDVSDLYGFTAVPDLELFERLIGVSGVGPKVALALLSELSADTIIKALVEGNRELLTQVSGVGKKIAERLIMELKTIDTLVNQPSEADTVFTALQQLGYSTSEIRQALQQLDRSIQIEQQIKLALNLLSRG